MSLEFVILCQFVGEAALWLKSIVDTGDVKPTALLPVLTLNPGRLASQLDPTTRIPPIDTPDLDAKFSLAAKIPSINRMWKPQ